MQNTTKNATDPRRPARDDSSGPDPGGGDGPDQLATLTALRERARAADRAAAVAEAAVAAAQGRVRSAVAHLRALGATGRTAGEVLQSARAITAERRSAGAAALARMEEAVEAADAVLAGGGGG